MKRFCILALLCIFTMKLNGVGFSQDDLAASQRDEQAVVIEKWTSSTQEGLQAKDASFSRPGQLGTQVDSANNALPEQIAPVSAIQTLGSEALKIERTSWRSD